MYVRNEIKDIPPNFATELHIPSHIAYNLRHSWPHVFREKILRRINEDIFSVLYSSKMSRPNVPVNQLLAFGILAAYKGMSLGDVHEQLLTNLEFSYALDLLYFVPKNFQDDGKFDYDTKKHVDPFSLVDFTRFLNNCEAYRILTGGKIDLIHIALEDLFRSMAIELEINGKVVRMDSMMVNSYIKTLSRKELFYVANSLLAKELNAIPLVLPDDLQHYLKKDDRNTVLYHATEPSKNIMEKIISESQKLVEFCTVNKCRRMKAFKVLDSIMKDQLIDDGKGGVRLRTKEDGGMDSSIIQSPHDLDATFRLKNGMQYRGYIANLVEALGGWGTIVLSYDFQPNTYSDAQFYEDYLKNYVDLDRFDKIPENLDKMPKLSELKKIAEEAKAEKRLCDSLEAKTASEVQTQNTDPEQSPADSSKEASGGDTPSSTYEAPKEKLSMAKGTSVPPEVLSAIMEGIYSGNFKEAKAVFSLQGTDKDFIVILDLVVKECTDLGLIVNDGAFQSMENTIMSLMRGIVQIPTNLTGKATPDFMADFVFLPNGEMLISCAGGQQPIRCTFSASTKTCFATFEQSQCESCPHFKDCKPRKTTDGYLKLASQASKIRACYQRFRSRSQFSTASRFRNGIETLPSLLRRKYGVDRLPVRGLFRGAIFFGFRVAGLNVNKLLLGLQRKTAGDRRSLECYAKPVPKPENIPALPLPPVAALPEHGNNLALPLPLVAALVPATLATC